ncbi:hypothetical protein [Methylobacterium gnaphalii]|uniref:Uncharacterized protein n=1 Tax=Methylobacterium gnaphalii TaxID=1010610 RepID=A0A512JM97_9HYPH|nr:hypothetical protein [Methylobacterium gnaphalii]GEP10973.1 hypothetical protein MGN01_28180 [Methylobacterium gnaphalii]GJD69751.1 hypothetical protein MMMDOFMJ_2689 [Methylobacterium gnaphalii]GLS50252.1 hypothetical protein GCM10007885_31040 [Methylobacterium gnaphalii]
MKLSRLADWNLAAVAHRVRRLHVFGLALAVALCCAAAPGDAASRIPQPHGKHPAKPKPAKVVKTEPTTQDKVMERVEPTGVWTSGEGDRACYTGRRKLWQDGQGWLVKRVAICP